MGDMIRLTYPQKLEALSLRFYQGLKWEPKAGDYYTTSRADLELYQVVSVDSGQVKTRYCDASKSEAVSSWPVDEFTDAGFGPKRVWVPDFVLAIPATDAAHVNETLKSEHDAGNVLTDAAQSRAPFFFDRYINGVRMAEDVCIERETTLEGAMQAATRIAAKGPNGEAPVLVYRAPAADARAEALKEAAAAIDPAIFDHPSVYMNGPSYQAQRKAKAIRDMILALITEKQP